MDWGVGRGGQQRRWRKERRGESPPGPPPAQPSAGLVLEGRDETAPAHGYRPDVDGLRAVAVLAVALWHYGAPGVGSGYVGVDVFFVISGFVITGVLSRDADAGRLSIRRFYERRVRRIAPALLVLLAAVLAAAVLIQWPARLVATAEAALAAVFLVANLVLARTGGYFAEAASRQPLHHVWSLSVEEQFYLVYPLVFAVLRAKAPRWLTPFLLALLALSLAGDWLAPWPRRGEAYFLAQSRAWELLLGALVFLHGWRWRMDRSLRESLAVAGAGLIAVGCLWPGVSQLEASLAASVGAALVICSGAEPTMVGRGLSLRPVVFVGLISYSLYLWHWPLLVFAHELWPRGVSWPIRLMLLAASFGLAALSWRFVERPFRHPPATTRARVGRLVVVGAGAVAIAGVAVAAIAGAGWPGRWPPQTARLVGYLGYEYGAMWRQQFRPPCFASGAMAYAPARCFAAAPGHRSVLLWGDSHAADLAGPLAATTEALGASFLQATESACAPLLDEPRVVRRPSCAAFNRAVVARIAEQKPDVVVISFAGAYRRPRLAATLAMLRRAGASVIVVGPSPQFVADVPDLLGRAAAPTARAEPADVTETPFAADRDLAAEVAASPGVRYISLIGLLCPGRRCLMRIAPDIPLMWDTAHFDLPGAQYVTRLAIAGPLTQALNAAPPPRSP